MSDVGHPRRRPAKLLLKTATSVVLGLVLLEVAVRLVAPVDTFIAVPKRWDPDCGVRMIENGYGLIDRPEYFCEFHINELGLRERAIGHEAAPGERRVLCLGDSYTCGFGVAAEEAFPRRLEEHLQTRGDGDPWRAINAGVGATGTAHQLAYYELDDELARREAESLPTYYADDGHWNVDDHRVYGAALARRLAAGLDGAP